MSRMSYISTVYRNNYLDHRQITLLNDFLLKQGEVEGEVETAVC